MEGNPQSFNAAYLPMSTSSVFDRFGELYDTARVLDATGLQLNVTAYNDYSPVYMPITYLVSYGTSFMLAVGILVHTVLFYGPDIWNRLLRQHVKGDVDIHMKLMRNYPDVPDWAYLAFLLIAFALSAVTVSVSLPSLIWGCESADGHKVLTPLRSAGQPACPLGRSWYRSRWASSTWSQLDTFTP